MPEMERIMVTGHRQLRRPELVDQRMGRILDRYPTATAISGGAQGADSRWAHAAHRAGRPYELWLPNRWYRSHYPDAISDELVADATAVHYVIDRPDVDDWKQRWTTQRWWQDNFARNTAMVTTANVWVVVSDRHPRDLASEQRGGTAACVRDLARRNLTVVWLPDRDDVDLCRVPLTRTR